MVLCSQCPPNKLQMSSMSTNFQTVLGIQVARKLLSVTSALITLRANSANVITLPQNSAACVKHTDLCLKCILSFGFICIYSCVTMHMYVSIFRRAATSRWTKIHRLLVRQTSSDIVNTTRTQDICTGWSKKRAIGHCNFSKCWLLLRRTFSHRGSAVNIKILPHARRVSLYSSLWYI